MILKAPIFQLPYLDDQSEIFNLEDHLGNIIVLTFWTSWCPECSVDLMLKEKLYQASDKNIIKFLTINVSGRERNTIAGLKYFREYLTQPTLIDRGVETYRTYNCHGVPKTVIINPKGELIKQITGQVNLIELIDTIRPFI